MVWRNNKRVNNCYNSGHSGPPGQPNIWRSRFNHLDASNHTPPLIGIPSQKRGRLPVVLETITGISCALHVTLGFKTPLRHLDHQKSTPKTGSYAQSSVRLGFNGGLSSSVWGCGSTCDVTPQKTNMAMENPTIWRCIPWPLLNMSIVMWVFRVVAKDD